MDVLLSVLTEIAKQGILGLFVVVAFFVAYKKDKEIKALHTRLENKTEKMMDKYYALAIELKETMHALTDAIKE